MEVNVTLITSEGGEYKRWETRALAWLFFSFLLLDEDARLTFGGVSGDGWMLFQMGWHGSLRPWFFFPIRFAFLFYLFTFTCCFCKDVVVLSNYRAGRIVGCCRATACNVSLD